MVDITNQQNQPEQPEAPVDLQQNPNPQVVDTQNPQQANKLPFKQVTYEAVQRGSLISCQYSYWKHDPYPLILITDVGAGPMVGLKPGIPGIRGINLHYLTYHYISDVLNKYCGQTTFTYNYIKNDRFIVKAFRTYKKAGIKWVKQLDCDYIQQAMKVARSFRPDQIKQIRQTIEEQLSKQINPKANEMVDQYTNLFVPNQPQNTAQTPIAPTPPQPPIA